MCFFHCNDRRHLISGFTKFLMPKFSEVPYGLYETYEKDKHKTGNYDFIEVLW